MLSIRATERILIIGDTHIPACHPDYLDFVSQVRDEYDLTTHIHVGDVTDWQSASFHEHDPDLTSPGDELELIRSAIQPWAEEFPDLFISEGNHCKIPARRLKAAGLPKAFLKDANELYGTPAGWVWQPNYIQFELECGMPVVVQHSFAASLNAGKHKLRSESVVAGHHHSQAGVVWNTDTRYRRFFLATGCGVDHNHPAFDYGKNGICNIVSHGCGIIIDGAAYHIPMFLDEDGRWNGKVP